jgi:hypothetical protein
VAAEGDEEVVVVSIEVINTPSLKTISAYDV